MEYALLVHQASRRVTQGEKTVIFGVHPVTVAREGIDEQLQLVVGSF